MSADLRRFAPATERNREPLLAVLCRVLPKQGLLLEVASGSGEHAVFFAERLPGLVVQPTDPDPDALLSIDAWRAHAGTPNLRPALRLDVHDGPWLLARADAILCVNMIHISPWSATQALMAGAARLLEPGAPLVTYGPYTRGGQHTAPSNAAFDESLRARDPTWGVRDLDEVAAEAEAHGFELQEVVDMPANNLSLVFRQPRARTGRR